jgi:exosome complex component CSL4
MADVAQVVLPGDEVAVAEEFEAGEGTYEEHGHIFAAQPGRLTLDTEHRVARVNPFNPPGSIHEGDVIYGVVHEVRGSMTEARVLAIHGRERQVAGELTASLHVSKIANAYIEDIRDAMRLGDIIRARAVQTVPSLQVTTAEANLGVVLALCSNCRGPMDRAGADRVRCPRCERTDRRKLAADYGTPELIAPIPRVAEPEGERRPREDRGDRGGRERGGRDRGDRGDRGRGRGGGRDRGGRGGGGRGERDSSRRDRRR